MSREEMYQQLFGRVDTWRLFQELFDLLPDVTFFVKDRSGRFIMVNRSSCEYCHVGSQRDIIGKTDHDFFPRDRSDAYVRSDRQVMASGVPIINAIELAPEEEGSDKLIIYSKVPVRDRKGRIIGVAGIHREVEGMRVTPKSYGQLSAAVQHMHSHYDEPLTTQDLAEMAGISASQFDRRFRRLFGASPRQYLMRVRVNAACNLLSDSDRSITDVALQVGFYDHSHFSRTFSRLVGTSPLAYRQRHRMESLNLDAAAKISRRVRKREPHSAPAADSMCRGWDS